MTVDLDASGFLVATEVVAVFLGTAAAGGGGRLTSFFPGAMALLGCVAAVLPEGGAVAALAAAVLAVERDLVVAVAALEAEVLAVEGGLVVAAAVGAVAALEAPVLAVERDFVVAAAVEALAARWEVGAVAGLEDFTGPRALGFVEEEVPDFEAVDPVGWLCGPVVLGFTASVFFGVLFAGLVPLVIVVAAEACPVGFLSGILT